MKIVYHENQNSFQRMMKKNQSIFMLKRFVCFKNKDRNFKLKKLISIHFFVVLLFFVYKRIFFIKIGRDFTYS